MSLEVRRNGCRPGHCRAEPRGWGKQSATFLEGTADADFGDAGAGGAASEWTRPPLRNVAPARLIKGRLKQILKKRRLYRAPFGPMSPRICPCCIVEKTTPVSKAMTPPTQTADVARTARQGRAPLREFVPAFISFRPNGTGRAGNGPMAKTVRRLQ